MKELSNGYLVERLNVESNIKSAGVIEVQAMPGEPS